MPPKLTDEQWKRVGEQYIANVPLLKIANEFGVSRESIRKAAKRYNWVRLPNEEFESRVQAKLATSAIANDGVTRNEFIEAVSDSRAALLIRHQGEWRDIDKTRKDAKRIITGHKPLYIADMRTIDGITEIVRDLEFKDLKERVRFAAQLLGFYESEVKALTLAQEGERRSFGMDYKDQGTADQKDEAEERERKKLLLSLTETVSKLKAPAQQKETA